MAVLAVQLDGTGIDVTYVAHMTPGETMSAAAIVEMQEIFEEMERDLRKQAGEQLSGREERWRFERRSGQIAEQLAEAAAAVPNAGPEDTVVVVVGSSGIRFRAQKR